MNEPIYNVIKCENPTCRPDTSLRMIANSRIFSMFNLIYGLFYSKIYRMTKEVPARFADSIRPKAYAWLYRRFYGLFESHGGINVVDAGNIPRRGKKVVTGNHDKKKDPWMMGVVNPESLFSLGKEELGSWQYLWVGKWALEPFMNVKLITRTGRDYDLLEKMAEFMMEEDAAVQSYIYGTRQPEKKEGAMPKTGVAHLAIRSSTEEHLTPVVPFGHSTAVWTPGKPIQVVVGEPIYAPANGRELKGAALKSVRREMTFEIVESIGSLVQRAIELDAEGAGTPGEIRWNV